MAFAMWRTDARNELRRQRDLLLIENKQLKRGKAEINEREGRR